MCCELCVHDDNSLTYYIAICHHAHKLNKSKIQFGIQQMKLQKNKPIKM